MTKWIAAQKAVVTNAWSLMKRIHTHGLKQHRRALGGSECCQAINRLTLFLSKHATAEMNAIIAAQGLTKSLLE
ncbi:hypothetical protein ACFFYR_30185 [Paraburkholderia dipogonis]|nr:hypothetical protein [Paraburkholderia dipogonis]